MPSDMPITNAYAMHRLLLHVVYPFHDSMGVQCQCFCGNEPLMNTATHG